MTVWSPWVDAKYSPSAENASAIVDFAVSGRGMYEADLPEPYMSSRLQSSRSLRLRPVSSRWNSSEFTPVRLRRDMLDDMCSRTVPPHARGAMQRMLQFASGPLRKTAVIR